MVARIGLISLTIVTAGCSVLAQNSYQVISIAHPGTIRGIVKWSGPQPPATTVPINKDPQVCDPESAKKRDLERLVIGPDAGVANTVVFLKNIPAGKAMDLPEQRRFLDQKHCRYEPHIMLIPANAALQMKSSDSVLHTVHMDGAATYNLPFPFPDRVTSRDMPSTGLINIRCNGGHVWMNAEAFVVPHPYYAVTDSTGKFEMNDVPSGEYQIVAWHEGWKMLRESSAFDVLTERRVQRPVFSDPRTWEKTVSVKDDQTSYVSFTLSEK